ncbi:MAG: radical SAM protein [bacterium]
MQNRLLKLLFVNVVNDPETTLEDYPIGLYYILSNIKKNFPEKVECRFIYKNYYQELEYYNPDIVLLSSMSCSYTMARRYAEKAKNKNKPVVIGGCHITTLPISFSKYFDIGVIGEAEYIIIELIKNYCRNNFKFNYSQLEKVKSLVFRKDNKLFFTSPANEIENLDKLPLPDRSPIIGTNLRPFIFTSRGCPYKCSYCAATTLRKKIGYHSSEYVLDDIKQVLKSNNTNHIILYDDLFTINKKRVETMIKALEKNSLLGKLSFTIQTRANLVDKELVTLLNRMGVKYASMGLDSGNQEILNYLKGKNITVEDNYRAVSLLKGKRILTYSSFIIGSPRETESQIMDTYKFILRSGITLFDVLLLTPLPGTPIWTEALKKGLVNENEDFDWGSINYQRPHTLKNPIILSETMTMERLFKYLKKFQYLKLKIGYRFLRTKYRWQYLKEKNIFSIAKQLIKPASH